MLKFKYIFYIGTIHDFSKSLETRFDAHSTEQYKHVVRYGTWRDLFEFMNHECVHLLLIDFSSFSGDDLFYALKQMSHLKNIVNNPKIPIVGVFENKKYLLERNFLLHSGVNYFHIVGDDFNLFFGNIYYIAFEDVSCSMKFAQVLRLQIDQEMSHPVYLSGVSESGIRIESDLLIPEVTELSIMGFVENNAHTHDVLDQLPFTKITNSFHCYETSFSFCSDWGESNVDESDGVIPVFQDNVDSWIQIMQRSGCFVDFEQVLIHYYSPTLGTSLIQTDSLSVVEAKCRFFTSYDEVVFLSEDTPDLIFYEITTDEDVDNFDHLICMVANSTCNSQSIILVKNHPSNVRALRKVYQYDFILDFRDSILPGDLKRMIESKSKKKQVENYKVLEQSKNVFTVYTSFKAKITSLTENEITIKTQVEIPYFTVIQISEPFLISIIIVPSYMNLSPNINGHHYMGLIMGINQKERQFLRKVVRRFMDSLPEDWSGVSLSDLHIISNDESLDIEENSASKSAVLSRPIVNDFKITDADADADTEEVLFVRKKIGSSRSKL
jgi:hypothetical protein